MESIRAIKFDPTAAYHRVVPRALPLLLLCLACLACLACGTERSIDLAQWTLHRAGAPGVVVTLPGKLDRSMPEGRVPFELHTRVTVPAEWRGQPLTLALPFYMAPAQLTVNGSAAPPLESNIVPGAPASGSQSYRVDGSATAAGELALILSAARDSTPDGRIDTVPRLSATPYGDRRYLAVRTINGPIHVGAFVILSMIGFTYFILYFFDRRRSVHVWFALQAVGPAYALLELLGVTRALIGPVYLGVYAIAMSTVAGVYFAHEYFGFGRPHVAFRVALVAVALVATLGHGPFHGGLVAGTAAFVSCAIVAYLVVRLVRAVRHGRDRTGAALILAAWTVVLISCPPNVALASGAGEILGGAHTLAIGLAIYCCIQAAVLGRDHIRSLRDADARIAMLEKSANENALLSDELRRQIADRSQRLADALARIGAVPERSISFAPDDRVHDRYRVVRRLGAGGMGAVYEVERLTDGRHLALKVLTSANTGVALARLAREAQVAAQLTHENLVSIVDVDVSESGALYLVMELIDGAPLHDSLARYGETKWALGMLQQIARGLAALHEHDIVHRDLKPGNVLVTTAGVVKIADFGIARIGTQDTPDPLAPTMGSDPAYSPTEQAALTGTGILLGTPLYMAPEIARGARAAGAPCDIWSFGVVAHELISARPPFATPPVLDMLAGRDVVVPSLPVGAVPIEIERILARCLAIDPRTRPTAREIAAALGDA